MEVHHVVADDGGKSVGCPVAVGETVEIDRLFGGVSRRVGELTADFRVVEHLDVLLPPDVGRAAEGFA